MMGTFAETAIIDLRLSFANQGKQSSIFRFLLQLNKQKFAISVSRQTEVAIFH
jgi:hypothetical protein